MPDPFKTPSHFDLAQGAADAEARLAAEEQAAAGWLARCWRPLAAACAAAVAVLLVLLWLA